MNQTKVPGYDEKFIGPLNVKQSVYAGVALAIILFLWLFAGIESMIIKVAVTFVVFVIAAGVVSFGGIKKQTSLLSKEAQGLKKEQP
jgi:uncharacterized membrane protein